MDFLGFGLRRGFVLSVYTILNLYKDQSYFYFVCLCIYFYWLACRCNSNRNEKKPTWWARVTKFGIRFFFPHFFLYNTSINFFFARVLLSWTISPQCLYIQTFRINWR